MKNNFLLSICLCFFLFLIGFQKPLISAEDDKKIALITGANKGIGLALTERISSEDHWIIIATCRSPSTQLKELAQKNSKVIIIPNVDISDLDTLTALNDELIKMGIQQINLLIHNAGISEMDIVGSTKEQIEQHRRVFEVNYFGLLQTQIALDHFLGANSIVINIASRCGSFTQTLDSSKGISDGLGIHYHASKGAGMMAMACLSNLYKKQNRNIWIYNIHPGVVQTDMNSWATTPPAVAASNIVNLIFSLKPEDSGLLWDASTGKLLDY